MGEALHRAYGETIVLPEELEEESLLEKNVSLIKESFNKLILGFCGLFRKFKSINKE